MSDMASKLLSLWPEITLGVGAVLCLFFGLWPSAPIRRQTVWIAGATIIVAGVLAYLQCFSPRLAQPDATIGLGLSMASFIKLAVAGVGFLLWLVAAHLPDSLPQIAQADGPNASGKVDPAVVFRGEFFAFFLLSLAGVMLVAQADDLVWLFLALELVSLPTYVMVAISRPQAAAQEAGLKYFFLGALAVAIFLYGFALIYGASGVTRFADIRHFAAMYPPGEMPALLLTGLVLAMVGIAFKIAAFPMHFYAADVYEGAATPVTAFLAFVPKVAGFVAIILMLSLADPTGSGQYPSVITGLLWLLAAFTMTLGNVLGLLQTSVKRVLAYSSIAHSGYMLVGLVAGVSLTSSHGSSIGHGIAAVLFYLVAYGLATLAAFAVLGCLRSSTNPAQEANSYEDLAGLARRKPLLAGVMLLAILSLIGLPPLVGFLGKIYLFGSAIQQGFLGLVILAVLNSAVSAVYYLRIAGACFFTAPVTAPPAAEPAIPTRQWGAMLAVLGALVLGVAGGPLVDAAHQAGDNRQTKPSKPMAQRPEAAFPTMPPSAPVILEASEDRL